MYKPAAGIIEMPSTACLRACALVKCRGREDRPDIACASQWPHRATSWRRAGCQRRVPGRPLVPPPPVPSTIWPPHAFTIHGFEGSSSSLAAWPSSSTGGAKHTVRYVQQSVNISRIAKAQPQTLRHITLKRNHKKTTRGHVRPFENSNPRVQ